MFFRALRDGGKAQMSTDRTSRRIFAPLLLPSSDSCLPPSLFPPASSHVPHHLTNTDYFGFRTEVSEVAKAGASPEGLQSCIFQET